MIANLTSTQLLAASKLAGKGQERPAVGIHEGQVAFLLNYSFEQLASEEYTPTVATPLKAVLALLIDRNPELKEEVQSALNDALELKAKATAGDDEAASRIKALCKDAPQATNDVSDLLAALPKAERKGKIINVEVEAIPMDLEAAKEVIEADIEAELTAAAEAQEEAEKAQEEAERKLEEAQRLAEEAEKLAEDAKSAAMTADYDFKVLRSKLGLKTLAL